MAKRLAFLAFFTAGLVAPFAGHACRVPLMKGRPWPDRVEMAKEEIARSSLIVYGEVTKLGNYTTPAVISVTRTIKGSRKSSVFVLPGFCNDPLDKLGERRIFVLYDWSDAVARSFGLPEPSAADRNNLYVFEYQSYANLSAIKYVLKRQENRSGR